MRATYCAICVRVRVRCYCGVRVRVRACVRVMMCAYACGILLCAMRAILIRDSIMKRARWVIARTCDIDAMMTCMGFVCDACDGVCVCVSAHVRVR
jgi:hypothetical protein